MSLILPYHHGGIKPSICDEVNPDIPYAGNIIRLWPFNHPSTQDVSNMRNIARAHDPDLAPTLTDQGCWQGRDEVGHYMAVGESGRFFTEDFYRTSITDEMTIVLLYKRISHGAAGSTVLFGNNNPLTTARNWLLYKSSSTDKLSFDVHNGTTNYGTGAGTTVTANNNLYCAICILNTDGDLTLVLNGEIDAQNIAAFTGTVDTSNYDTVFNRFNNNGGQATRYYLANIYNKAIPIDEAKYYSRVIGNKYSNVWDLIQPESFVFPASVAAGPTVISRTLSDSITVSDNLDRTLNAVRQLAESIDLSDTIRSQRSKIAGLADSVELNDVLTDLYRIRGRKFSEAIDINDNLISTYYPAGQVIIARILSDEITVEDIQYNVKQRIRQLQDDADISDTTYSFLEYTRRVADDLSIVDNIKRQVEGYRQLQDSIDITDEVVRTFLYYRLLQENIDVNDNIISTVEYESLALVFILMAISEDAAEFEIARDSIVFNIQDSEDIDHGI